MNSASLVNEGGRRVLALSLSKGEIRQIMHLSPATLRIEPRVKFLFLRRPAEIASTAKRHCHPALRARYWRQTSLRAALRARRLPDPRQGHPPERRLTLGWRPLTIALDLLMEG
jgi:hypothetical protein